MYKWANNCVTFRFFDVCVVKNLTLFCEIVGLNDRDSFSSC